MNTVVLLAILIVILAIGWKVLVGNRFGLARKRYAITLKGGEGEFIGLLTESRWARLTFEHCVIPPSKSSDPAEPVPGRVHIDRTNIAYLQELSNDPI